MRIHYGDRDLGDWSGWPTLREARRIKAEIGMLPNQFRQALRDMDPDANAMLAAIMLARNGEDVPLDQIDGENCMTAVTPVLTDEERAALQATGLMTEEEGKAEKPKDES